MSFEEELKLAETIARKAGDMMLEKFQGEFTHREKDDGTNVTEVDEAINRMSIESVLEAFPEHAFLGEEESHGDTEGVEFTWVCDPIDGTHAFMMGMPTNVFSLALTKDGVPVVAVIFDPYTDRLFTATTSQKTRVNGEEINVSDRTTLDGAVSCFARDKLIGVGEYKILSDLKPKGVIHIDPWSACYVGTLTAGGHIDFMVFPIKNAHDVAAVKLLVEQAGGTTSDLEGNDQKYDRDTNGFVASNGHIHDEVISILKNYIKK